MKRSIEGAAGPNVMNILKGAVTTTNYSTNTGGIMFPK
jgi:hypothetical protein